MSDLGLELLKLVDDRALHDKEINEKARKQLSRFSEKLEKSRGRFGKNLENLAKDLRKRISKNGFPSLIMKVLLPWRRYADKRQLELIEVLISWNEAESREFVQAMNVLAESYDTCPNSGKAKE